MYPATDPDVAAWGVGLEAQITPLVARIQYAPIARLTTQLIFFVRSEDDAMVKVVERLREVRCEAGRIVCREGEKGDYFYIVESGVYAVYKRGFLTAWGDLDWIADFCCKVTLVSFVALFLNNLRCAPHRIPATRGEC